MPYFKLNTQNAQNAFGGQAPPGPAGGSLALPTSPALAGFKGRERVKEGREAV